MQGAAKIKIMFTPKAIRDRLHETPFRPFALRTSSGAEYPVKHPDFALVGFSGVEVGLEPNEEQFPVRFAHCSLLNVTELVDLAA